MARRPISPAAACEALQAILRASFPQAYLEHIDPLGRMAPEVRSIYLAFAQSVASNLRVVPKDSAATPSTERT